MRRNGLAPIAMPSSAPAASGRSLRSAIHAAVSSSIISPPICPSSSDMIAGCERKIAPAMLTVRPGITSRAIQCAAST
jgi:hypothetical protein